MANPTCMFCKKPITKVERGETVEGFFCWVITCPCDEWEAIGAKSKKQALHWFEFGGKAKKTPKQESLFG